MPGVDRVWTGHRACLHCLLRRRGQSCRRAQWEFTSVGLSGVLESIGSGGDQEVIRGELGRLDHSGWGLALNTRCQDRYEGPLTTATQTSRVPPSHRSLHQIHSMMPIVAKSKINFVLGFLRTVRRLEELKVLTQYLFHRSSRSFLSRDDLKYITSRA